MPYGDDPVGDFRIGETDAGGAGGSGVVIVRCTPQ